MSEDVLGYSSHDWRKNTDDAVVVDDKGENVFMSGGGGTGKSYLIRILKN